MPSSDESLHQATPSVSKKETASKYQLVVIGPDYMGRTFELGEGRHVLGRGPESDVRFLVETVSRRHALFVVQDDQVTVEDLGSRVGTFVNGRRIETSCSLPPGARILIGGITMKLVKG